MGAGVLFFDSQHRLLIVKPTYKSGWIIPGGVVEQNESPHQACCREVREEIGLALKWVVMVGLDYVSAVKGKDENLQFIFFGGILSSAKIRKIKLQLGELQAFKFVTVASALKLLRKKMARRLPHCLRAIEERSCVYLENGAP